MECSCFPNNGPAMTPEPHMIPGYMGYVPQYKYKFGNTYGMQTNRLFLDPCINMSPRSVLADVCPEDCSSGGFYQQATGYRYGNCGDCKCQDSSSCSCQKPPGDCCGAANFAPTVTRGYRSSPRFQTIMNHTYAPFCNRFCTKTFEQDQWRDRLFTREKQAMDGWRFCYKSKSWDRPERTQPWDGDHGEFRRTQTTLLPEMIKGGKASGAGNVISTCGPCDLYQRHMKNIEKQAKDAGLEGIVKYPQFRTRQGRVMQDTFCERLPVLEKLNKEQMSRAPAYPEEGVIEELGELPIITLHKLAQKREDMSGLFFPPERGLARVCNPIGSSYLTARPFRCNPVYRVCEPVLSTYDGHVPGEQFIPGERRGKSTLNALKYMTYRV